MSDYLSTPTYLPPIEEFGQRAPGQPTRKIPHSPIHILNDDALLSIFYLYRLDVSDEYDEDGDLNFDLGGQRWWYKLVQVCGRWRYLILASPSHLDLHLLCTHGVPIANILAHSPPLPLAIYYDWWNGRVTEEDEEGILLALRHSDRVHYISHYFLPAVKLGEIMTTMDGQFPILERLYIVSEENLVSQSEDDTSLALPRTFQAPQLRHLTLWRTALPIGSPLLTTTVGLVSLILGDISPSAYFTPGYLLTRLSLMPQLQSLEIQFDSPLPNRDVERQLLDTPIMTHITHPNLRRFIFRGVSTYLEGLLAQISTPILSHLQITLFYQLTFTVPRLLQLMDTSEILSFSTFRLALDNDSVALRALPLGERRGYPFRAQIMCRHIDWQVSSAIQILTALQPVLSVVEQLTLYHEEHSQSSEWHDEVDHTPWHNEVDRTQWRQLLRPFSNLKTLHVQNELVAKLARSLQTDDGEQPLELFPNLKEVAYSGGYDARDAFTPFIDERHVAGHPVNLTLVGNLAFAAAVSQEM